jgi:hypothetical protein
MIKGYSYDACKYAFFYIICSELALKFSDIIDVKVIILIIKNKKNRTLFLCSTFFGFKKGSG